MKLRHSKCSTTTVVLRGGPLKFRGPDFEGPLEGFCAVLDFDLRGNELIRELSIWLYFSNHISFRCGILEKFWNPKYCSNERLESNVPTMNWSGRERYSRIFSSMKPSWAQTFR